LIIANQIARTMHREIPNPAYSVVGRVATAMGGKKKDKVEDMYKGQSWASSYTPSVVKIIRRNQ